MVQVSKQVTPAQQVGVYLKKELAKRKISQERFAAMVYVEPRTVRRWIRNGVNDINTIYLIAQQLGVNIRDLLADCKEVPAFCCSAICAWTASLCRRTSSRRGSMTASPCMAMSVYVRISFSGIPVLKKR